jgi:hypothetical protein
MKTHSEMKKQYKETPVPMGVFLIRNAQTNQFVLGASRNLSGSLNMYKFVLKMSRPNDTLLKNPKMLEDYRAQGEGTFEFKVLDTLKPREDPGWDPSEDLKVLEKMWLEELKNRGWTPY